tara:strand:+ start:2560 stop:3504 length:945 start_codon:yes stop_codon:yes gene_type:complete
LNKYFLIPIITFFAIISILVFYLQNIYEDWKYDVIGTKTEKIIPENCDDEDDIKIIKHLSDNLMNRSFKDQKDILSNSKLHAIYLLPCDQKDRKFDINKNIHHSLEKINNWLLDKTKNQIIRYDRKNNNIIDTTFIRVNKTMKWFTEYSSNQNKEKDTGSKIEKIILSNSLLFNNFNEKKFIVFFEGWEKSNSFFIEICGRSRFEGKVAIFYTNSKNKKSESCTINNFYDLSDKKFNQSEETILHEILHTFGMPPRCAKNLDPQSLFHVNDNEQDVLNKVSGSLYLDYNNDDYYRHNIKNCNDLSNSNYLITIP